MRKPDWKTDADRLDKISFWGLESILCGTALSAHLSGEGCYQASTIFSIKKCVKEMLKYGYAYHYKKESKIIYFFSYEYSGRRDYLIWWKKVIGLTSDQYIIKPERKIHIIKNKFIYTTYLIVWLIQMRNAKWKISFKMACLSFLLAGKIALEDLKKELKKTRLTPQLFVSLCDVFPTDSIMTQYFNSLNIDTATMQHAFFPRWKKMEFIFTKSTAKYFLSWGEMTNELALDYGLDEKKLITIGPPQFIDAPLRVFEQEKKITTIAVFLNGPGIRQDNAAILETVNQLCAEKNLKYYIRLHPAICADEIWPFIDKKLFEGFLSNTESVYFSLNKFQMAITGNTTMFAELVFYMFPSFRYTKKENDMYASTDLDWCRYSSFEELSDKLREFISDDITQEQKLKKTRERLFVTEHISENYKGFFEGYIRGGTQ